MKVLLDTHIFIWYSISPEHLSAKALSVIENADTLFISVASIWEMQIKVALKKLDLGQSLPLLIGDECRKNDFRILSITQDHIYRLEHLPPLHKDPFDRMLIAQAQHEDLTLVTTDGNIPKYAVQTAW
jgi:PIN domain nuclease of toxin-antitoxin system